MQYRIIFLICCLTNCFCAEDTLSNDLRDTISIANEIFSLCAISADLLSDDGSFDALLPLGIGKNVLAFAEYSRLQSETERIGKPLTCLVTIGKQNNDDSTTYDGQDQLIDFHLIKYDGDLKEKYEIYASNGSFSVVNAESAIRTHTCITEDVIVKCKYVKVLRMVYDAWSPLFMIGKDGSHSGILHDVLLIIVGRLGLQLELVMNNEPGHWGTSSSNSSYWRGMVGMVQRGEVDGCTAGTAITIERSSVVDFTFSSLQISVDLLARYPNSEQVSWENYLLEFDLATWVCIVTTSFVLVLVLALVLSGGFRVSLETWSLAGSIVIRALLLKGTEVNKTTLSVKSAFLCALLFSTVILTCYRSSMNAFLAVIKPTMMSNLEDVLDYSEGLTLWSPSLLEYGLSTMAPDSTLGKLYSKFRRDPRAGYTDYITGLNKVKQHNYVMAESYQLVRSLPEYDCDVYKLDVPFFYDSHISFFFAKNSPYVPLFNQEIIKLKNQGVLERIVLRYLPGEAKGKKCAERVTALGMVSVFTPFLLVIFGIIAGVFLSILERMSKFMATRVKKISPYSDSRLNSLNGARRLTIT